MPGSASGSVTVANTQSGLRAERRRGFLDLPIDALDAEPDRADDQRKRHHRRRKRGAGPSERELQAEHLLEPGADRPAPAEHAQQQVAGDDRRHDQRQMDEHVEQRAAPEAAAREQPGDADRRNRAGDQRRDARDLQAEPDDRDLVRGPVTSWSEHREALSLEHGAGRGRSAGTRRAFAAAGLRVWRQRRRDKRWADARTPGNVSTTPTRGSSDGVGAIDDAERRLAARDQQQRGADVLRRRPAWLATPSQTPSAVSAACAYLPAGTAAGSASASRSRPSAAASGNPGAIFSVDRRRRRRDQDQPIAEQVDARLGAGPAAARRGSPSTRDRRR